MKYEEMKDLINNIIENEFNHVQEYREKEFTNEDEKQLKLEKISRNLFNELYKNIPKEFHDLLDDFDDAVVNAWTNLCMFYFKEGVRAGAYNLNFLKSIKHIECHIN